jgi:hypothetical protein
MPPITALCDDRPSVYHADRNRTCTCTLRTRAVIGCRVRLATILAALLQHGAVTCFDRGTYPMLTTSLSLSRSLVRINNVYMHPRAIAIVLPCLLSFITSSPIHHLIPAWPVPAQPSTTVERMRVPAAAAERPLSALS